MNTQTEIIQTEPQVASPVVPSDGESAKVELNRSVITSGESENSLNEPDSTDTEKIPDLIKEIAEPKPLERFKAKLLELKERFGLLKNQELNGSISHINSTSEAQTADSPNEKINVVEAMLAEVPDLSAEGKERIRRLFPDGKVCCPIKVARAIQLELMRECSKGLIKFSV